MCHLFVVTRFLEGQTLDQAKNFSQGNWPEDYFSFNDNKYFVDDKYCNPTYELKGIEPLHCRD